MLIKAAMTALVVQSNKCALLTGNP